MKPMVPSDVKCYNRRVVFETLRREKLISRSELSRVTGISVPTVFKIVQDFCEKGLVVPSEEATNKLGRKPMQLRFHPDAYCVAGVELEGARMRVGLFNLAGELRSNITQEVGPGFTTDTGALIAGCLDQLVRQQGVDKSRVAALGIGFPGVVDSAGLCVRFAPLVGITEPLFVNDVIEAIRSATGLFARIENDANAAAYGEMIARSTAHDLSLLYLSLGTGLGGGLILSGQLRRGGRFLAGEVGYWIQGADQRAARDEQGPLEAMINLRCLENKFGYAPGKDAPAEMIDYLVAQLAMPIANAVNLLDIEMVVLDGIVFEGIAARFIPALERVIRPMALSPVSIQVSRAPLPGPMGAAMLAFHESLEKWLGNDAVE